MDVSYSFPVVTGIPLSRGPINFIAPSEYLRQNQISRLWVQRRGHRSNL